MVILGFRRMKQVIFTKNMVIILYIKLIESDSCNSSNNNSDIWIRIQIVCLIRLVLRHIVINHSPVQLKFSEYCGEDNINGEYILQKKNGKVFYLNYIYTLYVGWSYFKLTHNDLHLGNILFKPTTSKYIYYNIEDVFYKIPTYGYIVKTIDWNRATFQINGTFFQNECFDRDGDCYGQFIFPENYYYNKKILIPDEHSDLLFLLQVF